MENPEEQAEIQRLRQALDAKTQASLELRSQLDRASAEFEEFISRAAHDLREPLREVASFGQLIAETYAGRLDSEAREFLQRIRDGAAKAQSLLTGVVDYWATAGELHPSEIDMEAVLRHALLLTDRQITERGAIVTHDPLPAVMGDFEILAKVLHHLIRNAIEYCTAPSPSVHISSRKWGRSPTCPSADLAWLFSVADNGPGIDPAFKDRIFEPFKRLHGKEYPGNGLGLAFCKKAIESHGGKIWMEPVPGAGSTFCFTLPQAG